MKKLSLALPVLVAAALAVSGCAKPADDANATALNDVVLNDSDGADANLTATDTLDANGAESNVVEGSGNTL